MEYLIFIGVLVVIHFVYHIIRFRYSKYYNLLTYIDEELGIVYMTLLIMTVSCIIIFLMVWFIILGGSIIRYLFM